MNFGPLTAKIGPSLLSTLRKFCIFLHCWASHSQFSRHNSTKLSRTVNTVTNCSKNVWVLYPAKKLGSKNCGPIFDYFATQWQLWVRISPARNWIETIGKWFGNYKGSPILSQNFMNFGPLTAKNRTVILPTFWNHHLLGGGDHHVGLPLGVPTFLVMLYCRPTFAITGVLIREYIRSRSERKKTCQLSVSRSTLGYPCWDWTAVLRLGE